MGLADEKLKNILKNNLPYFHKFENLSDDSLHYENSLNFNLAAIEDFQSLARLV